MDLVLKIDEEFRSKIPPLTEEEFKQLEQNILEDREVHTPIVVWNGIIVDGHNRWEIIQKHPDIPYKIKKMSFTDKWAAFDWMYKNQLGRRNLTDEQRTYLLGKLYEARKHSVGEHSGNQYTKNGMSQNLPHSKFPNGRTKRIADVVGEEQNVSGRTVQNAYDYATGIDAIKEIEPEVADDILNGKKHITKQSIVDIKNASPDETKEVVKAIKDGTYKRKPKVKTEEDKQLMESIHMDVEESRSSLAYVPTVDDLVKAIKDNVYPYIKMLKSLVDGYKDIVSANRETVIKAIDDYVITEINKMKEEI